MTKWMTRGGLMVLVVGVGISVGACQKEKSASESAGKVAVEAAKEQPADKTADPSEQAGKLSAMLAKADQLDGAEDKVVSRCGGCKLRMDGDSEHALETSGYTLHFCCKDCKNGFAADTAKSILSLNIP